MQTNQLALNNELNFTSIWINSNSKADTNAHNNNDDDDGGDDDTSSSASQHQTVKVKTGFILSKAESWLQADSDGEFVYLPLKSELFVGLQFLAYVGVVVTNQAQQQQQVLENQL